MLKILQVYGGDDERDFDADSLLLLHEHVFPDKLKKFSWSVVGSILSLSYGHQDIVSLRETIDGLWERVP